MATLAQIYDWFMTGKKPTQAQFWASWGSFWNKGEAIPQSAITNLTSTLNAKAEKSQFDGHIADPNAHITEFNAKEDKENKGVAGGYAPLDEFERLSIAYLKYVNDLVTGGEDAVLTAEQGKQLKIQIDAINTLLASDNINLDTVQELVDAIETVQTSLSTILVNDLTTGGTTKALTAEMGKSLKALIDGLNTAKVDKVAGERLINAAEITKLGNQSGTNTGDQDLSGKQDIANQIFVNTSGPVLDSWHGKLVTFTGSVTITVPASGLRTNFNFEGTVDPTFTVSTAITAPKVWLGAYTGAAIPENSIFTFIQRANDDNKVSIYGL